MYIAFHGSLDNLKSIGTNNLIKEGAKIAVTPEDIIKNYTFMHKVNEFNKKIEVEDDIEDEYKPIYNAIRKDAMDLNDIAKQTKLTLSEVISKLTMLELEGKVKKVAGNKYKKL